jgi:recombinational DNA repair protein RecT
MTEIAKQEIVPVTPDSFSADFAKGHFLNIEHMLGSKEKADKFIAQSTYYLKMNPDIIEKCSPSSIMKALIKCAELDLYPSSAS